MQQQKKNAQLKLDKTKQKHDFVYLLLLFRIFKTALIVFSFAVKLHVTEKVQFFNPLSDLTAKRHT